MRFAAFISDFTGVRDASSALGYAGGFVAYVPNPEPTGTSGAISASAATCAKDNTCVDYAHWVAAAEPTDTPHAKRIFAGYDSGVGGGLTKGMLPGLRALPISILQEIGMMVTPFTYLMRLAAFITLGFIQQPDWAHLCLILLPVHNGQDCFTNGRGQVLFVPTLLH